MDTGVTRSEYSRKFQTQKEALDHYNMLAPISFTDFRARNRYVTKYFIRNMKIVIKHFFLVDTSLLVDYVLCENPEYSSYLVQSIGSFMKILDQFEDLEAGLSKLGMDQRLKTCEDTCKAYIKSDNLNIQINTLHNTSHKEAADSGANVLGICTSDTPNQVSFVVKTKKSVEKPSLERERHINDSNSKHNIYGKKHVNTGPKYVHYVKILRFILNRFQCSFIDEIDAGFMTSILCNFNNENTITLLEEIFKVPNVFSSHKFASAFRESKFLKDVVTHPNQESASRILEMLLEMSSDAESTIDGDNYNFLEELRSHADVLVDLFLLESSYSVNILQFKNILTAIGMNIRIRSIDIDFKDPSYKTFLKIQLMTENYKNNLDMVDLGFLLKTLDLSFKLTENTLVHNSIYSLSSMVLKNTDSEKVIQLVTYLIPRLYTFFMEYWAQEEGPKPYQNGLYPFLIDIYILLLEMIAHWSGRFKQNGDCSDILSLFRQWETEEWNTLRCGFLSRAVKKEGLRYANTKQIFEWLEDCISEPFLRYLCHVIVEDLPDHDFFHQEKY